MGAYMYCQSCMSGLPAPHCLRSIDLLEGLFGDGVQCPYCKALNDYYREALLEELAEALDKIREVER